MGKFQISEILWKFIEKEYSLCDKLISVFIFGIVFAFLSFSIDLGNTYYWTFSTIIQAISALIGVFGIFVIYRLQLFGDKQKDKKDTIEFVKMPIVNAGILVMFSFIFLSLKDLFFNHGVHILVRFLGGFALFVAIFATFWVLHTFVRLLIQLPNIDFRKPKKNKKSQSKSNKNELKHLLILLILIVFTAFIVTPYTTLISTYFHEQAHIKTFKEYDINLTYTPNIIGRIPESFENMVKINPDGTARYKTEKDREALKNLTCNKIKYGTLAGIRSDFLFMNSIIFVLFFIFLIFFILNPQSYRTRLFIFFILILLIFWLLFLVGSTHLNVLKVDGDVSNAIFLCTSALI